VGKDGNVVKYIDRFEKKDTLIKEIETQLLNPAKTEETKTTQPK